MRTVTLVGASLAGLYAARELRAQGYDGRLVVVGDEPPPPYDRPPLSKDFLTGRADEGELSDEGPGDGGFLARYARDGTTVAVLPVDRPRPFTRARRALARAVESATT